MLIVSTFPSSAMLYALHIPDAYYNEFFLRGMPQLSHKSLRRTRVKGTGKRMKYPKHEPDLYSLPYLPDYSPTCTCTCSSLESTTRSASSSAVPSLTTCTSPIISTKVSEDDALPALLAVDSSIEPIPYKQDQIDQIHGGTCGHGSDEIPSLFPTPSLQSFIQTQAEDPTSPFKYISICDETAGGETVSVEISTS